MKCIICGFKEHLCICKALEEEEKRKGEWEKEMEDLVSEGDEFKRCSFCYMKVNDCLCKPEED